MAGSLVFRRSSGQRRFISRFPSRIIALVGLVGTCIMFQLSIAEGRTSVAEEDKGSYSEFLGRKARSLAQTFALTKHSRDLGDGQAVFARPAIAAPMPTPEEVAARDNWRTHSPDEVVRLCPACDCTVAGFYTADPSFTVPISKVQYLRDHLQSTGSFQTRSMLRYLLHHIPLSSSLDGLFLKNNTVATML